MRKGSMIKGRNSDESKLSTRKDTETTKEWKIERRSN
jgi:hypothetical protein